MESPDGSARTATGHNSIPAANDRNTKRARTKVRKDLNDIQYPGALTSRLKRYAAEPAPDGANLTSMCERTLNGTEILGPLGEPTDETGRPAVRQSRTECPERRHRSFRGACFPASGMFQKGYPRSEMSRRS